MYFTRKGNVSSQILASIGVLLLAAVIIFWVRGTDPLPENTVQSSEESAAHAMEILSQGKTTEVLLGVYTETLKEFAQVAEGWTDESSAAMIQTTEDMLLSLRVPAPLRAAHLQAVVQVQTLSSSDLVRDVSATLRDLIQNLLEETHRISTE